MTTLYGSLQALMRERNGGRYLAQLLKITIEEDPAPFRRFLSDVMKASKLRLALRPRSALRAECETAERSPTSGEMGRADLSISIDGVPLVHVEIKYDDTLVQKERGDLHQLAKYIDTCKRQRRFLLVLTKTPLRSHEQARIDATSFAAHRSMADLGPFLERSGGAASRMLYDYLREKGLVMNPIQPELLYLFFHRMFNSWGGASKVGTRGLQNAPAQFSSLLLNMALIADDITPYIKRTSARNRAPAIDFNPVFRLARKSVERSLGDEGDGDVDFDSKAKRGGTVYVYARHNLGDARNTLSLVYGLEIIVAPRREHDLVARPFAELWGAEIARALGDGDEGPCLRARSGSNMWKHFSRMESSKPRFVTAFLGEARRVLAEEQSRRIVKSKALRALRRPP